LGWRWMHDLCSLIRRKGTERIPILVVLRAVFSLFLFPCDLSVRNQFLISSAQPLSLGSDDVDIADHAASKVISGRPLRKSALMHGHGRSITALSRINLMPCLTSFRERRKRCVAPTCLTEKRAFKVSAVRFGPDRLQRRASVMSLSPDPLKPQEAYELVTSAYQPRLCFPLDIRRENLKRLGELVLASSLIQYICSSDVRRYRVHHWIQSLEVLNPDTASSPSHAAYAVEARADKIRKALLLDIGQNALEADLTRWCFSSSICSM
jgi:hypothetical protein